MSIKYVQALVGSCPLHDSMKAFSVGFPGRVKSSYAPRQTAQYSSASDMNAVPWSTVIDWASAPP